MKDSITAAAVRVLLHDGLPGWSVDRVAREAGCAKGLVHYHHGTKRDLLLRASESLGSSRRERRLEALQGSGAATLDRLWALLVREVRHGEWAAWASLTAAPDLPNRAPSTPDLLEFGAAIGRALDLPPLDPPRCRLAVAALDGFQVALALGDPEEAVHEAYHRLWLALLD